MTTATHEPFCNYLCAHEIHFLDEHAPHVHLDTQNTYCGLCISRRPSLDEYDLVGYRNRLREGRETLVAVRAGYVNKGNNIEAARIAGKIEGLNLALSYLRDYE